MPHINKIKFQNIIFMKTCRFRILIITNCIAILGTGCVSKNKHMNDATDSDGVFYHYQWELDTNCVIPRGESNTIDNRVAGDPCIVWDKSINTWRMFYFGGGTDDEGNYETTGMAIAKSAENIASGDWTKIGEINISNPEDIMDPRMAHKWWVVMEAHQFNRAAVIEGKYWSLFTCTVNNNKHIQAAWAEKLAGPWNVLSKPILSPDENFLDGKHCDTPTAYWFPNNNRVVIFYKAYPKYPQKNQAGSEYGSGTVLAYWNLKDSVANKIRVMQRPGQMEGWNQGWMSTPQIFYNPKEDFWYGLINGSPTPPEDESHREPAPSLGGWVRSKTNEINSEWIPMNEYSPLKYPSDLTKEEQHAGLGTNFWRHHLLVTPEGKARIFFNSGFYGKEQMYSWRVK